MEDKLSDGGIRQKKAQCHPYYIYHPHHNALQLYVWPSSLSQLPLELSLLHRGVYAV